MKARIPCLVALVSVAVCAHADEIRLKDGTKIIGTIVGFEEGSFKVQTSYGFALVRKDKIAAIIPSEPKPEAKAEPKPAAKREEKPAALTEAKKEAAEKNKEAPKQAAGAGPAPKATPSTASAPGGVAASPSAAKSEPTSAIPPAAPKPVPAPPPAAESLSPPIREEIRGNLYINHTYGFQLYKAPSWHVIEGAQKTLPTAIVAMGTGDETTLLIIGREKSKESLDALAAATERQLSEIYENYRRISEQRSRVAGLPALERRFRGTVNGHDWSGTLITLLRGGDLFTILGVTYADSDLIQIQENVIARTISSLEFTTK